MTSESVWFRAWVANAVHAVSGIWPYDWSGSQRKCPLTVEEIRAAACQEAFAEKFEHRFSDPMRDSVRVCANEQTEARKLH